MEEELAGMEEEGGGETGFGASLQEEVHRCNAAGGEYEKIFRNCQ